MTELEYILYFACLGAIILSIWAQIKVNGTFRRFSEVRTASGRTAATVARDMLDRAGLYHVRIERVGGNLTDHYDPKAQVLRLSTPVHDSSSAAAVGVAAHEAGHAIQHAEGYAPIKFRTALVPVTSFASRFSWLIIIAGILIMSFEGSAFGYYISLFGIGLFAFTTLFQLVTLPCEFNASSRALAALDASGYYTRDELSASKKVLSAAALTYVASFAVSLLQLLRLLAGINRRR